MADKSKIEWTDATWNIVTGCSVVSPACTNCYAMAQAARIVKMETARGRQTHYAGTTKLVNGKPVWTGSIHQAPEHILTAPLRWKRPRRIFVNSMSDLFHESVPDEWIDRVFAVMALAPQHTFQVLTKRPKRMREYISRMAGTYTLDLSAAIATSAVMITAASAPGRKIVRWPLPNVWLGITAEDQPRADERIPELLATPAAVRFVSIEPMLGAIDLDQIQVTDEGEEDTINALTGEQFSNRTGCQVGDHPALDWVICGGESGPNARPMHPNWARSLRDQCKAADVPFFFKQWGEWTPHETFPIADRSRDCPNGTLEDNGDGKLFYAGHGRSATLIRRVGKARAGRLLEGHEHNEFPGARR